MNRFVAATAVAALSASGFVIALGSGPDTATVRAAASKNLVGTFTLAPGRFSGGKASGSYLRMTQPDGKPFANPDSSASDRTYTLISPGTDGGLTTGRFQDAPRKAFDSKGNSLAARIMRPARFTAIRFSAATASKYGPAPSISVSGRKLRGQLRAFTAAWNKQNFNQGSSNVTGTYNSKTRRYVLKWTSKVRGGAFNGFLGTWHLEGKFRPRG